MDEKKTNVLQSDFRKGYFIEVDCAFCMQERIFAGDTKTEVSEQLKNEGWKYISSDLFGLEGYYCGCDYKENQ